jgi:hypothetical protein
MHLEILVETMFKALTQSRGFTQSGQRGLKDLIREKTGCNQVLIAYAGAGIPESVMNLTCRHADQPWWSTWSDPGKVPELELIEVLGVQLETQARKGPSAPAPLDIRPFTLPLSKLATV